MGTTICGSSSRGRRPHRERAQQPIAATSSSGVSFESMNARASRPAGPSALRRAAHCAPRPGRRRRRSRGGAMTTRSPGSRPDSTSARPARCSPMVTRRRARAVLEHEQAIERAVRADGARRHRQPLLGAEREAHAREHPRPQRRPEVGRQLDLDHEGARGGIDRGTARSRARRSAVERREGDVTGAPTATASAPRLVDGGLDAQGALLLDDDQGRAGRGRLPGSTRRSMIRPGNGAVTRVYPSAASAPASAARAASMRASPPAIAAVARSRAAAAPWSRAAASSYACRVAAPAASRLFIRACVMLARPAAASLARAPSWAWRRAAVAAASSARARCTAARASASSRVASTCPARTRSPAAPAPRAGCRARGWSRRRCCGRGRSRSPRRCARRAAAWRARPPASPARSGRSGAPGATRTRPGRRDPPGRGGPSSSNGRVCAYRAVRAAPRRKGSAARRAARRPRSGADRL